MKKFFVRLLIALIPLALIIAFFSFLRPHFTGDIGKMSMIAFFYDDQELRKNSNNSKLVYDTDLSDLSKGSDVLLIGDSFTCHVDIPNYSYILADKMPDLRVENYANEVPSDPVARFVNLLNSNLIKSKVVILQTVERSAPFRLAHAKLDEDSLHLGKIESKAPDQTRPLDSFVTDFRDFCYKKTLGHSSTIKLKLSKPLFSSKFDEDNLYFYHEDTTYYSDWLLNRAAEVLDTLYQMAESKNIKLIFAICPDKSHLYKDYIVDNPYKFIDIYPFFERFENQHKYVDVKKLLKPLVDRGELDVYLANDTHWSRKSAELFAEELKKCVEYQLNN